MTYAMTIEALADPTRRTIVERLRDGPLPVVLLARDLPISRPAVSQHLRILADAGIVFVTPDGARRLYALRPDGMTDLRAYIDGLWDDALGAFARAAATDSKGMP
jgi:DNA-binding transcriptional ArsR family regulator